MIKALIYVAKVPENIDREDMQEHLSCIQKAAAEHNIYIEKAFLDFSDLNNLERKAVKEMIQGLVSANYDIIIVDDTFGFTRTMAYKEFKKVADDFNTALYLYGDRELTMSEKTDSFDYKSVKYNVEVFKERKPNLKNKESDIFESFSGELYDIRTRFERTLKDVPPCEMFERKAVYVEQLMELAGAIFAETLAVQKSLGKMFYQKKTSAGNPCAK